MTLGATLSPPLVSVSLPPAASAEERFRSLKRLRPRFKLPQKITSIWWPRYVNSLVDSGVWNALVERVGGGVSRVDIVGKRRPGLDDLREGGLDPGETLYGLYSGVPLTERSNYGFVLPDKITIFQQPLEQDFPDETELMEEA